MPRYHGVCGVSKTPYAVANGKTTTSRRLQRITALYCAMTSAMSVGRVRQAGLNTEAAVRAVKSASLSGGGCTDRPRFRLLETERDLWPREISRGLGGFLFGVKWSPAMAILQDPSGCIRGICWRS